MKACTRQRMTYIAGDLLAAIVATFAFNSFRFRWISGETVEGFIRWTHDPHVAASYVAFPLVYIIISAIAGFYNSPSLKSRYEILANTFVSSAATSLVVYFAIMVNDSFNERLLHYSILLALLTAFFVITLLTRYSIRTMLRPYLKSGRNTYNVLVVGNAAEADSFADRIEKANARSGYRVVGIVDDKGDAKSSDRKVYTFNEIKDAIISHDVKAFVVHASQNDVKQSLETLNRLYSYGKAILLPLDFYNLLTSRPKISTVVGEPLVDITSSSMSAASSNLKRMGDVAFSVIAIILLLPVYAAIAVAVKLDSRGPILYRQERVGLNRRKFNILKFRSMVTNAEPDGPALSCAEDKRVTKVGHYLRKYRLDELPQFFNILRGDMSLVGPRPEREYFLRKMMDRAPSVCTIHQIRPGITSLASVKFGYASDIDSMIRRHSYDLIYLENMSFSLDMKILFHTVNTVLSGKGV